MALRTMPSQEAALASCLLPFSASVHAKPEEIYPPPSPPRTPAAAPGIRLSVRPYSLLSASRILPMFVRQRAARDNGLDRARGEADDLSRGGADVISRIRHGWTAPANGDAYESLLKREFFDGIRSRQIDGYRGIDLLRRDLGEEVEFVTIMWFDSIEAVRGSRGEGGVGEVQRTSVSAAACAGPGPPNSESPPTCIHYPMLDTLPAGTVNVGPSVLEDGHVRPRLGDPVHLYRRGQQQFRLAPLDHGVAPGVYHCRVTAER